MISSDASFLSVEEAQQQKEREGTRQELLDRTARGCWPRGSASTSPTAATTAAATATRTASSTASTSPGSCPASATGALSAFLWEKVPESPRALSREQPLANCSVLHAKIANQLSRGMVLYETTTVAVKTKTRRRGDLEVAKHCSGLHRGVYRSDHGGTQRKRLELAG